MGQIDTQKKICLIIGASHAGVNLAFGLRKEGWLGSIRLIDADANLPYHRPPLSKTFLTSFNDIEAFSLKSADSYEQEGIELLLGRRVTEIDREKRTVTLSDQSVHVYHKLVFATGARAVIPPIKGLSTSKNVFPLRSAEDVVNIRQALSRKENGRAVVIGGGYIGLEIAASMRKLGISVTVLEREKRVMARVTTPEMSMFFENLHAENGVTVLTGKNVEGIVPGTFDDLVRCTDGSEFKADVIVVGVGIMVNDELAKKAGLACSDGIKVDRFCQTDDADIYAIGDCTNHLNAHYGRHIRLESVQNAVDQAKVAASVICGKELVYEALPWFWSDQYDVKLQIVGLAEGYDELVIRKEQGEAKKFSMWYFKSGELLAVDAVNNAKAYVIGTKFIKGRIQVDTSKLADSGIELKPVNIMA